MSANEWKAVLNGSTMCGGDCTGESGVDACLKVPPTGTGAPPLRVEDVTYPQRDGVQHFADWYEPRILTFEGLISNDNGCGCDGDARDNSRALVKAWSRSCDDTELVLFTGCEAEPETITDNFEGALTWSSATGTIVLSTTVARSPTHSLRATRITGTGTMDVVSAAIGTNGWPVIPGQDVALSIYARTAVNPRAGRLSLRFYDAGGSNIFTYTEDPAINDTTGGWTQHTISGEAPTGAAFFTARFIWAAVPLNEIHYLDDFSAVITDGGPLRATRGPFGVKGRARIADPLWRRGKRLVADVITRFDAIDHRLYVLNNDGDPGSGGVCITSEDTPQSVADNYIAVVAGQAVNHHWPMDATHQSGITAYDVIGAGLDMEIVNGFNVGGVPTMGPPISFLMGNSAVKGYATVTTQDLWTGSYGSGMIGWWHIADEDSTTPIASLYINDGDTDHWIGSDPDLPTGSFNPALSAQWFGSAFALDSTVRDALGFTDAYRGQAVFVIITWNATTLWITVETPDGSGGFNQHTQTVGPLASSAPTAPAHARVEVFGGRMSNMIAGAGSYASAAAGQAIADALTAAFNPGGDIPGRIVIPDYGDLCGPMTVSFAGPEQAPVIYAEDGNYVGLTLSEFPSTIDTDAGTATIAGVIDVSVQLVGDPFLQVSPGDTLYAFGGGDVTVCFRPSVLSA